MPTLSSETPHDIALALAARHQEVVSNLNEADTRHQYIDVVMHQILEWPQVAVKLEEHCRDGYLDYALIRPDGSRLLIIEAKKEGISFSMPAPTKEGSHSGFIKVKTLLTDPVVSDVISQVRNYCIDMGVQFAAITNGHQWIFFRTFQQNHKWDDLRAFVVYSLTYFAERFTNAIDFLGYDSIVVHGRLNSLLGDSPLYNRELYFPKDNITSFATPIDKNQYSQYLRPVIDRFFGNIDPADDDFIANCYVRDDEAKSAFNSAQAKLRDAVTPFLEQYGIQEVDNDESGGRFGRRLSKSIIKKRKTDVVVLFGGKGVGKSTFLRTLLYHSAPQIIKKNAIISIIDLLNTPEKSRDFIYDSIWQYLVEDLDKDDLLKSSRASLESLFQDRFEVAARQDLYGLAPDTERYNDKLNQLMRDWKGDTKYCVQRLAAYWASKHKAVIVVIDNTDQYSREIQEFCFTAAQEIANLLGCLTIISMREERFQASAIHGTLDAYQNSGFHIASPLSQEVFLRRLSYVIKQLSDSKSRSSLIRSDVDPDVTRRCIRLFRIFETEFNLADSHLANFLTACAHGNVRLALELFREIVTSGYTNIFEMTTPVTWTMQIHQVVKPIMIPSRFFYEESNSAIPNLYQIRAKKFGSHFTALRILNDLAHGAEIANPTFSPIGKILSEFNDTFGMLEDCKLNLDMMMKYKLIEANNRLDQFSDEVDSIRITAYGIYSFRQLSSTFTYLDLVSCDCAVSKQMAARELSLYSNSEYSLWAQGARLPRLEARISRADKFITYLEEEEKREIEFFALQERPKFMDGVRARFDEDKMRALKSAKRQRDRH